MSTLQQVEKLETLPPVVDWSKFMVAPPEPAPELIENVLRQGHKLLLQAPSKAGKSFLMIQLALSVQNGKRWLGRRCRQGDVLLLNMEIDGLSYARRIYEIAALSGIDWKTGKEKMPDIVNLRGMVYDIEQIKTALITQIRKKGTYKLLLIDPVYKCFAGSENDAADVGQFCRQLDEICETTGISVAYCHHFSKSGGTTYAAENRGSGSGVWARDADGLLTMYRLDTSKIVIPEEYTGSRAYRVEGTLREFAPPPPVNLWFRYPCHYLDAEGVLSGCEEMKQNARQHAASVPSKREDKTGKRIASLESLLQAYDNSVPLAAVASDWQVSQRAVRQWLEDNPAFAEIYAIVRGKVCKVKK